MGANFYLFIFTNTLWPDCWKHLWAQTKHERFANIVWFLTRPLPHSSGVFFLEQQAIWPIRWGPDLASQIGRTGYWPGHRGYRPEIPKNEFLEDRGKQRAWRLWRGETKPRNLKTALGFIVLDFLMFFYVIFYFYIFYFWEQHTQVTFKIKYSLLQQIYLN